MQTMLRPSVCKVVLAINGVLKSAEVINMFAYFEKAVEDSEEEIHVANTERICVANTEKQSTPEEGMKGSVCS